MLPPSALLAAPGRRLLIVALGLLLMATACGGEAADARVECTPLPDDASSVNIAQPWATGVERTYEIVEVIDFGGGLEIALPDPTYAKLRVGEQTDDGWVMSWSAVPSDVALTVWQFGGDRPLPTTATYRWGSGVDRPEVSNPFELGLWLGDVIDSTRLGLAAAQHVSYDENVAHYEALDGVGFDLLFLAAADMLHSLEGLELTPGQPLELHSEIVNGATDAPLRAEAVVEIAETVDPRGCVFIRMTRVPDPDDFEEAIQAAAAAQGGELNGRTRLEQTLEAQYDPATGFVKRITMTEEVESGGLRLNATTSIVDITGAASSG